MGREAHSTVAETAEETAALVGIITPQQNERKTTEYPDELEFLAETAGARTVKRLHSASTARRASPTWA